VVSAASCGRDFYASIRDTNERSPRRSKDNGARRAVSTFSLTSPSPIGALPGTLGPKSPPKRIGLLRERVLRDLGTSLGI